MLRNPELFGNERGAGEGSRTPNLRFTKAMWFVQQRSGLYMDALSISVCPTELCVGVHSCAPGLVSGLVSLPIFEGVRIIDMEMAMFTLK
jgi:hypothetical protein